MLLKEKYSTMSNVLVYEVARSVLLTTLMAKSLPVFFSRASFTEAKEPTPSLAFLSRGS